MAEKKEHKFHNGWGLLLSVAAPILFLVMMHFLTGIHFGEGTDWAMDRFLSGKLIADGGNHLYPVNIFLTAPVSLLYRLNPEFPWWKGLLFFLFVVGHAVISFSAFRRRNIRLILIPLADLALCFAYLYPAVNISHTFIAVLLSAAGYSVLISEREKHGAVAGFILLELLAYCLDTKAMLSVQLFGIFILLSVCHAEKERMRVGFFKILLSLAFVLAVGTAGRALGGDRTNAFKTFESFARMRDSYYSMQEMPSYDDVKEILEEYHVEEKTWEDFAEHKTTEWPADRKLYKDLIQYARKMRPKRDFSDIMKAIYENSLLKQEAMPVYILLIFSVLLMFLVVKFRYIRVFLSFALAHVITWGYLVFKGDMKESLTIPLLFAECMFLFMIVLSMLDVGKVFKKKKRLKQTITVIGLCIFGLFSFFTGRKAYRRTETERTVQKEATFLLPYDPEEDESRIRSGEVIAVLGDQTKVICFRGNLYE